MVFVDLSTSEKIDAYDNYSLRLANPSDRLLSFVLDFVIFSPVSALFAAGALKELKENVIENAESSVLVGNIFIYLTIFFSVCWVLQAIFLHFWNASPGQKFLNLKVVRFPQEKNQDPLSFFQCLTRVAGPWVSLMILGIPLLEIFSHDWRRTFYDRVSDTLVITMKRQGERSPLPFEARFIRQWMQVTSFLVLFVAVLQLVPLFMDGQGFNEGKISLQNSTAGCADVNLFTNQKYTRLDRALALYLVNKDDLNCLQKELSRSQVFGKEPNLAYFARYLLEKDKQAQEEYQKHLCHTAPTSAECGWTKKSVDLPMTTLSLQVLQAQKWVDAKNWALALRALDKLVDEALLFEGLQKTYVQSYISFLQSENSAARAPASVDVRKLNENFKKRYGVK